MEIFAIPPESNKSWSKTSLAVFSSGSKLNIYLSYDYSISDVMPPFTNSKYAALVSDQKIPVRRRNVAIAIIEDTAEERTVNQDKVMLGLILVYVPMF